MRAIFWRLINIKFSRTFYKNIFQIRCFVVNSDRSWYLIDELIHCYLVIFYLFPLFLQLLYIVYKNNVWLFSRFFSILFVQSESCRNVPNPRATSDADCYHPLSLEDKLSDFVVYKEFNKLYEKDKNCSSCTRSPIIIYSRFCFRHRRMVLYEQ